MESTREEKGKRFLLMCFMLVLSLVLAACNDGGKEGTDDAKDEDKTKELNLVIISEPPSLHPQLATDTTSGAILMNVFEGLTTLKDGEVEMAAAEDVKISDDQLTYTFTLRDAKWSNGDAVTADDFAYAWEFALNPKNASEYATILYPIKGAEAYNTGKGTELGIKVLDEKTLEVTLENPTPYFLELTAFKTYYPIHKATAEANSKWYTEAGDDYITNGPFTLADWQHSGSITLEKNDNYWDVDNVALDKVNISMVESQTTAATMFDAGEIDFLGTSFQLVSLDAIQRYKKDGILEIADYSGVYMYKFNTTDEVMSNVNIRKALSLAIDREGLIKNITKAEEVPALGIVPKSVKGFDNDKDYFQDADFKGAKAALEQGLKELGLSDPSELNLKLSFNTSDSHSAIAQYIQEGWSKNLGINVTLDNSEWQVFLDKLSNLDYQMGRLSWIADYNDAYTFLEMYGSADNGNNDTGWENAKYTELLKQSNAETDSEARIEILKQAEGIIMSEFPIAPIYFYTNPYVAKDYVKNMKPDILGNIYLKYVDIQK